MRRICLILISLIFVLPSNICAQSFEEYRKRVLSEFNNYKEQTHKEFEEYRKRINAEYAAYLKRAWVETEVQPEIPAPKPNPPAPTVYKPEDDAPAPVVITPPVTPPITTPVTLPPAEEKPLTVNLKPIPLKELPKSRLEVNFFGEECSLHADKEAFREPMRDNSEKSVSKYWVMLSDGRTDALVNDCLLLREELELCDWAYYQLVKAITSAMYGDDKCNEAVVLQAYLMTQVGYKVRMGRTDDELRVLLSSNSTIYSTSYLHIGDLKYYLLQGTYGKPIYICDFEFPGERVFSLKMDKLPLLPMEEVAGRELQAQKYPSTKVVVNHNGNMLAFLETYPHCSIDNYAIASLDDTAKDALYPVLKKAIDKLPEDVAANVLINFVQTAFEYKVDDQQFGYERSFFANETLYYPFSDCEDRSVLFATLVRDLLGLDVVLLDYPNHIATAVCFKEDVEGDYMMINDKKYLVCDPTYIGANIGHAMPSYRTVAANIVKIN